ncbi:MarR family winged helix-turn-helix transcriptional regulator [Chryseolinea soli]|uniref:MarR family transcriptional regulator n=1 Tax=Chryseolinea soli TaxID=2321403 RepID=A0A385SEH8_9BACT|nr:MarR family winged helix-turn-helix transcriptional regulator [Chryseolinea soli]AYB29619.1 MarR family transcriptional regulator [Chryseolinea soli]
MSNLINELGELALSTRLMRLSEGMRKDVTRIYHEHGIDFESKWFPVLYVLSKRSPLSVLELANEIGYTHPSVIALVKEMEKKKLVKSVPGKDDGRKRMLHLTPKALDMVKALEPLWYVMRLASKQVYNNGSSLLKAVEDAEAALDEQGYYERYKKVELGLGARRSSDGDQSSGGRSKQGKKKK